MGDIEKIIEDYFNSGGENITELSYLIWVQRDEVISSIINDIESAMIDMNTVNGSFIIDGGKYIEIKRKYTESE